MFKQSISQNLRKLRKIKKVKVNKTISDIRNHIYPIIVNTILSTTKSLESSSNSGHIDS